jgi:hypothetical protein
MSGPSIKPKRGEPVFAPHPDDEKGIAEGIAEIARGEGIPLTREEVDHWAETGELPERAEKWQAERSSSRRGT